MKRLGFAGLLLVALLFAAQVASAEGWPGCPWGSDYDPMANGYVPACFSRPAEAAAFKLAGLAGPSAAAAQPSDAWWFARPGYAQDSFNRAPAAATSRAAGLASPSVAAAQPSDAWWFARPGYTQDRANQAPASEVAAHAGP
jgi:hypothetical protein